MYQILDIDGWNRKDHFQFFNGFDFPYFDLCFTVDCTRAYQEAKKTGAGFFKTYLYYSLLAANEITPFRYRIKEGKVLVYDRVNASPVITRPDGTFGFAYIDFIADKDDFMKAASEEIERTKNGSGLTPAVSGENVIHYSVIPWVAWTAVGHARNTAFKDSIPKITFGKITERNGEVQLPVSVSVHHGLMDAFHVSQYADRCRQLLS
jgi:chloramphenicol O-acetyltransferase type A